MAEVSNVRQGEAHHVPKERKSENGEVIVEDSLGRILTLRKPSFLNEWRILQVVGAETAKNERYMAQLAPLLYVYKINDDMIGFPSNPREVDALVQRVDRAGYIAVMLAIAEHFQEDEGLADAVKKLGEITGSGAQPT